MSDKKLFTLIVVGFIAAAILTRFYLNSTDGRAVIS